MSSPQVNNPGFMEQVPVSAFSDSAPRVSPTLVFKDILQGPGFSTTVACKAGWVNFLQCRDKSRWEKFQRALWAESDRGGSVHARLGNREVNSSDVRFALPDHERWEKSTPWEVLVSSGAPEWLAAPMLTHLGLLEKARIVCSALTPCELQRLSIATALSSREMIVYFEGLHSVIQPEWRDRVATLLADSAKQSYRIFVILDTEALSSLWCAPRAIEWLDLDAEDPINCAVASTEKGVTQAMWSLERLLLAGKLPEEVRPDVVITKPIAIHENPQRAGVQENVAVESIPNPEAAWESSGASRQDDRSKRNRKDSSSWKRTTHLTRVAWWERAGLSFARNRLRGWWQEWSRVALIGDAPEKGMPANARILHTQRWEWIWEVFVTPIVIILLVFAIAQLL